MNPDRTTSSAPYVQAVTIHRPGEKWGMLMRVVPGGRWKLRETDANGDEETGGEVGR